MINVEGADDDCMEIMHACAILHSIGHFSRWGAACCEALSAAMFFMDWWC